MKSHYLFPSNIFVSKDPFIVTTVLGSCISVCLYDQVLKIGGLNHFMLPLWNGEGLATPKYGNIAIEKLIIKLENIGCCRGNLIAKVFGGAEQLTSGGGAFQIGIRNAQVALEKLKEEKIPVISYCINGNRGRKIQFLTHTGEVYMKFLGEEELV
jgi:chemotaxis protein CheD